MHTRLVNVLGYEKLGPFRNPPRSTSPDRNMSLPMQSQPNDEEEQDRLDLVRHLLGMVQVLWLRYISFITSMYSHSMVRYTELPLKAIPRMSWTSGRGQASGP